MVENMLEDRRLRVLQFGLVIAVCSSIIHEGGKKKGEKKNDDVVSGKKQ